MIKYSLTNIFSYNRYNISIGELRESDPHMFSSAPQNMPRSTAGDNANYLKTSQGNVSIY